MKIFWMILVSALICSVMAQAQDLSEPMPGEELRYLCGNQDKSSNVVEVKIFKTSEMFYDRLAIVVLDEEKNRHVVTTTDLQDGDDMTYIIYFSESLKADLMFDYPEMTKSPVLFTWGQERHWMDCVSSKSEGESEPNSESLR